MSKVGGRGSKREGRKKKAAEICLGKAAAGRFVVGAVELRSVLGG